MSHAYVVNNVVQLEGSLPASARRLDNGDWVMGLPNAQVKLQEDCGWYRVVDTAQPADTGTTMFQRDVKMVDGYPTEVWVERPKTTAELEEDSNQQNHSSIIVNLEQDMTAMQATIDATNASINSNPAVHIKAIARMNRRLGRLALNDLDGAS